jgi:hypothetical protein
MKARKLLKSLSSIAKAKITKVDELISFAKAFKNPDVSQTGVHVIEGSMKDAEGIISQMSGSFKRLPDATAKDGSVVKVFESLDGKYKLNLRNFSTTDLKPPFTPKPNATIDVMPLNSFGKVIDGAQTEIKFGTIGRTK